MILGTALLIKILLPVAACIFIWWMFRASLSVKSRVGLVLLCALFAGIANHFSDLVPPLTDTVTMTALGENGQGGKGQEVFVRGYTVDGEEFEPENAISGKWVWYADNYGWRPETDTRQPEGTTRTVVLEVPVGWERTVDFDVNEWRGWVEVTDADGTKITDTSVEASAMIGRSETSLLILNQIKIFVVYMVIFGGLCALWLVAVRGRKGIAAWSKSHKDILLFAAIALFQLAFAIYYSGIDCLWVDELYEVGWVVDSETAAENAFRGNMSLPLFSLIRWLWYPIAPYGERWLLLPMEIITAVGIFFVGMAGKELRNVYVGTFGALFAAVSSTLLVQSSYEMRHYPFYFASAAILLWLFLKHLKGRQHEGWKEITLLTLCMVFFAGMHFHAVVSCVALFIIDFFFLAYADGLTVKRGIRMAIPYGVAALSYIPIIVNLLVSGKIESASNGNQWQTAPDYKKIVELINYFSSNSEWLPYVFAIGCAVVIICLWYELCRRKKQLHVECLAIAVPLLWILIHLLTMVVAGIFRAANGSSSLWSNRYFLNLMPAFFVLAGIGVDALACTAKKVFKDDSRAVWAILLITCLVVVPPAQKSMYDKANTVRQAYRDTAAWTLSQINEIYSDDTVIICTDLPSPTMGLNEYYFSQQGKRDPVNLLSQREIDAEYLADYNRIYLLQISSLKPRAWLTELLNSEFELTEKAEGVSVYVREMG